MRSSGCPNFFGAGLLTKEKFQSYSGYATEYNQVIVQGSSLKGKTHLMTKRLGNTERYSHEPGNLGAEGWNASKNFVSIKRCQLLSDKAIRQEASGVIGGRGFLVTASIQAVPNHGSLAYGTKKTLLQITT